MNDESAFSGLDKPEVPLSEAVYYLASKSHARSIDARQAAQKAARLIMTQIQLAQLPASGVGKDGARRPIPVRDFCRTTLPQFGARLYGSGSSLNQFLWANGSTCGDAIELDRRIVWRNICIEHGALVKLAERAETSSAETPTLMTGERAETSIPQSIWRDENKAEKEAAYKEYVDARIKEGCTQSSANEDLKAMRKKFPDTSRDDIRDFRRSIAPHEWIRHGRRKTKTREK